MGPVLPFVSVIVVNAKGTRFLGTCVSSLLNTDYPSFEVIVVDCLSDDIENWMQRRFPNVRIIHFDRDVGASEQHNVGFRHSNSRSKYVSFLDNDTTVERDWLRKVVGVMEND